MKTFVNKETAERIINKHSLQKNGLVKEYGNADLSVTVIGLVNGVWEVSSTEEKAQSIIDCINNK